MEELQKNNQTTALSVSCRIHPDVVTDPETGATSSFKISMYTGAVATGDELAPVLIKIKTLFPSMSAGFVALIGERMIENNFTVQRAVDAYRYVADNFTYRQPTVADFIRFDKCVKLYNYGDCLTLINRGIAYFGDDLKPYFPVLANGQQQLWYRQTEIDKFKYGK